MQYAEHRQELRHSDRYYALAQMAMHRARPRNGVCVVDPNKRCARAWRCGFAEKVDGCASFLPRTRGGNVVATSCKFCARRDKTNCGWQCVMEVAPKQAAQAGKDGAE